ncbi:MAG: DNA polymerase III subunit beta [bacterium]
MKVECIKEKLYSAVSKADKVTGKNLTLPVLSCVLLEAKGNFLTVKATNLDLGLEIKVPAKIESEGVVAVPGSVLNSFLSNLQDDKSINLELVEGNLVVFSSNNKAVIKTFTVDDFPTIPSVENEKVFILAAADFVKGLKAVWYSASTSNIKPELSSVYIHSNDDGLVFVATDSFRLAEKTVKAKKVEEFGSVLIPFKNVADILKIINDEKEEMEVNITKNQISLKFSNTYVVSRVIDGVFPDYKQIIPKEFKTEVVVLKQDLVNTLKISNIFSDTFNQINIKALASEKKFEFRTKNSNVGENVNNIQAAITGEDVEINFNFKYIIDCFQSIDSDSVSMSFNGLAKPMVIKGVSDKSFTYLVMPMNR